VLPIFWRYPRLGMRPLVTQAWLWNQLADPRLVVVDCRFDLTDPAAAGAAYAECHIAGAVRMDLDDDLSGPGGDAPNRRGRHPLPTAAGFAAAAGRAGISPDSVVVAYDDDMTGGAARLWWCLRHFGHERVAVLGEGMTGWRGPVDAGVVSARPGRFASREHPSGLVDAEALGARSDDTLVVDVRAPERYRGEREPIDAVAGHVPGAVNIPVAELVDAAPRLAQHRGAVVAYCGSGVAACVLCLALAVHGRRDAALYAGSWSDWIARGLPVATGAAPG
jgi:thiosulfate/3-mercaptopyruvate sulfurtransferase